jgi:DHA2 family multidrug resistance protein
LLGAYYILPQFAAVVKGWRELQIGEILIWLALLPQVVLTPLSALPLRYVDSRLLLACGLFTFSVGAYMATYITSDWYIADFLPGQLVQACAFSFIMPPLVLITTSLLTPANAARLGIVPTLSTFAYAPYLVARIVGTLDQISGGRGGKHGDRETPICRRGISWSAG